MSGWIKLHRTIQDNDLWLAEPFTWAQAWVDLLLSASHKPRSFFIRKNEVQLERGQLGWSEITMGKRWQWSRGKVRRYLAMLEARGMIVQQTSKLTSIVTICNYEEYQETLTPDEQPVVQQMGQQTVHPTDNRQYTNKNDKKEKKEKNKDITSGKKPELDFSKWPQLPEDQTLADWQAMRKRQKAQVTQTVINRLTTELTKAVNAGYTVDQCIAECCLRNWRGFQLEWMNNTEVKPNGYQQTNGNHNADNHGRAENNTERAMRIAREAAERIANAGSTSH